METFSKEKRKKKQSFFAKLGKRLYNFFASINKFRRSSFLSIFILIIIFLLVKALDQAYTLLVDMIEDEASMSLILCYIIISVFALVISHYPIYTYYAKDINDSKDENYWYIHKWFGFYNIFTFNKKPKNETATECEHRKKEYQQDYLAKYFRYSLGLLIFSIWTYYIYKTYEPKLLYAYETLDGIWWWNLFFYATPFIIMLLTLPKKQQIEKKGKDSKAYKQFYTYGVISFYAITVLFVILLLITAFAAEFNTTSYYLLQFLTLTAAITYICFRLFRTKLDDFASMLVLRRIEVNFNYVLFFFIIGLLLFGMIIYCNIAVAYDLPMPNAMVILFGYFYIIYYGLACILKYLFVIQAVKRQSIAHKCDEIVDEEYYRYSGVKESKISKIVSLERQEDFVEKGKNRTIWALSGILGIIILSMIFRESPVHELDTRVPQEDNQVVHMYDYMQTLDTKIQNNKPLIFVASHGGALKANIWTMKLLNHLQKETDGEFLNQTASFSGASGGMMGLSMYAVLAGQFPNTSAQRFKNIDTRIDEVALKNYASMDISYTLGWDFLRKAILLREISKHRDRAYYSMVSYRNILEAKKSRKLDPISFQNYWKDSIYTKNTYFPAILVNTAKTNGRRGVFSAVRFNQNERDLFLNADNLAQLEPVFNGKRPVISFYQAVSCTNRFPGFSPAAKIKGYGHYIDAGAIDNSGLLTSLDWYDQLKNGKNAIIESETNVIFVEIINGQSNYIKHLLEEFKKETGIDFIQFNEKEQGNLSAVISAGANLDKNPDYFSDLIKRMEKRGRKMQVINDSIIAERNAKKYRVKHMPIYLPRVITLDAVESFIGGEIKEEALKKQLADFLVKRNNEIYAITEDVTNRKSWKTYEPTLARHLSESTLHYYDSILKNSTYIKADVCTLKKELQLICD